MDIGGEVENDLMMNLHSSDFGLDPLLQGQGRKIYDRKRISFS
jgi:hypothetical protein